MAKVLAWGLPHSGRLRRVGLGSGAGGLDHLPASPPSNQADQISNAAFGPSFVETLIYRNNAIHRGDMLC